MKHFTQTLLNSSKRCLLLFGAASLFAFSAAAQSPTRNPEIPVDWANLCTNTANELIQVTTESGDKVEGYCISVQHDELAIRTDNGTMVKVARGTLKTVLAFAVSEHRLKALGRGMKKGLHNGVKMTFSPLAPIGLTVIPATLAWGAVATPFCILGDLFSGRPARRVIVVR